MGNWPIGLIGSLSSLLIALKCLVIPCYISTDFEVHRNWLAITHNKSLVEWYTENTSEWTLDYPPFFAYFERILAFIAEFIGLHEILEISKAPVFNENILLFQRISVIVMDLFYIFTCALYSFESPTLIRDMPLKMKENARVVCFILLSCLPSLFLIDSIHFQYNSMLTSFFILSIYFLDKSKYCWAAFFFAVLVNFKHIYVYYALGYVFFYLSNYFDISKIFGNIPKAFSLGASLILPFILSIGPFLYFGGIQSIFDITARLFPVSRGLTHAFWAPNFWAVYNLVDLLIYRVLKILKIGDFVPPTYTSGLVQEYDHSVLPNITATRSTILVILSSILLLSSLVIKVPNLAAKNRGSFDFCLFAVISSLCFFFFGYHVHEKAIILITVPMTILTIKDIKYAPYLMLISIVSTFSLFPLLFTDFEIFLKISVSMSYLLLQLVVLRRLTRAPITQILPYRYLIYFCILWSLEAYNIFGHRIIWKGRFEFAPLIAISFFNALGIIEFLVMLIFHNSLDGLFDCTWQMGTCRIREQLIKEGIFSVQSIEEEEDVKIVGGLDISASKTNPDYAVLSMAVFTYPELKHVATVTDVRILTMPYIPQYLAIRESDEIAGFVKYVVEKFPHLRPDVLLCDGFGKFHSRNCGMACHVGALTGIPSIGVAKNLPISQVYQMAGEKNKEIVDRFMENLKKVYDENKMKNGYIPFDIISPTTVNVVRVGNSMSGVFVSEGYGIELDVATRIVVDFMVNNTTCEPIRAADLRSRALVKEYYDGN